MSAPRRTRKYAGAPSVLERPTPSAVRIAVELQPFTEAEGVAWPGARTARFYSLPDGIPAGKGIEALIPLVSHPVGAAELDLLPDLRVVANYGVGHDNVDVTAAAERGITVTNTPGVLTEATADLTLALILGAARRLREGLETATSGSWKGWGPTELLGLGLQDRVLGLLGAGRIGSAVARRAAAFGMRIHYWSRRPNADLETEFGAIRRDELRDLLREADVVSVHLPLTPHTEGLIGPDELRLMQEHALLVNTARGAIVNEEALSAALAAGTIAGAGLDVYAQEPSISAALAQHPRALLLPHLGSATHAARQGMWGLAAANARAVLEGREAPNPVRPRGGASLR
ncbi:MAG: D-glycerate dehydrogenase [Gemmatimonadota bacterium]